MTFGAMNTGDWVAVLGVLCGAAYVLLHWWMERGRRDSLRRREQWAPERFMEALGGDPPCDGRSVEIVLRSVADTLGIQTGQVRPADCINEAYRLRCHAVLLDETGELTVQRIRRRLKKCGVTGWRPRSDGIAAMIREVDEALSAAGPRKQDTLPARRADEFVEDDVQASS